MDGVGSDDVTTKGARTTSTVQEDASSSTEQRLDALLQRIRAWDWRTAASGASTVYADAVSSPGSPEAAEDALIDRDPVAIGPPAPAERAGAAPGSDEAAVPVPPPARPEGGDAHNSPAGRDLETAHADDSTEDVVPAEAVAVYPIALVGAGRLDEARASAVPLEGRQVETSPGALAPDRSAPADDAVEPTEFEDEEWFDAAEPSEVPSAFPVETPGEAPGEEADAPASPIAEEKQRLLSRRGFRLGALCVGAAVVVVLIVGGIRLATKNPSSGGDLTATTTRPAHHTAAAGNTTTATTFVVPVTAAQLDQFQQYAQGVESANTAFATHMSAAGPAPAQVAAVINPYHAAVGLYDYQLRLIKWPASMHADLTTDQADLTALTSFLASIQTVNATSVGPWLTQLKNMRVATANADNQVRKDVGLPPVSWVS